MKAIISRLSLCALCALAVGLLLACSQNEVHPSGPAPEAPKNPRVAKIVPKEGSGMNQMAEPEPMPGPPEESAAPPKGGAVYHGEVALAPALKGDFPKGAVLFIVARDPKNPGAPVAAAKFQPSGFPLHFDLSDADSMSGSPLPGELELLAKLSKTGAVDKSSPEDLEAAPVHARAGTITTLVLEKKK